MSETAPILKDMDREHLVPTAWRNTLTNIVARFVKGDFSLADRVAGVSAIEPTTAVGIAGNIEAYGDRLVALPDAAWETSVSSWQDGHWDVLVDLFTAGGASDLVLHVRVREDPAMPVAHRFDVHFVYVP